MSTNGFSSNDDTEMAERDEEKVVTMMDVLQEQQDFEEDANAVLGASDEKNCTYSKGYIKRQALYACLTCCTDAKNDPEKRAGVCLACSLACHENHELVELYTKRNFRCDCGNSKFNSNPCQFTPNKSELNDENHYNQNFSGVYCVCHRPYPDPEATEEDEMIQCIICEDWLHANHLEATLPTNETYSEMICKACMNKNEFLYNYSNLAINTEDIEVEVADVISTCDINKINNDTEEKLIEKQNEELPEKQIEEREKEDEEKTKDPVATNKEEKTETDDIVGDISTDINEKSSETEVVSEVPDSTEDQEKKAEPCEESNSQEKVISELNATLEDTNKDDQPTEENKTLEPSEENNVKPDDNSVVTSEGSSENPVDTNISDADPKETANEDKTEQPHKVEADTTSIDEQTENNLGSASTVTDVTNDTDMTDKKAEEKDTLETTNDIDVNESTENNNSSNISASEETVNTNKRKMSTEEANDTDMSDKKAEEKDTLETTNDIDINESTENNNSSNISASEATVNTNKRKMSTEEANDTDMSDKKADKKDTLETTNDIDMNESTENNNSSIISASEEPVNINKRKLSREEANEELNVKKSKQNPECDKPEDRKVFKGATFWPSNFRQKLCTCSECLAMYKDLSVLFLTDPEDTVTAYEALGKERINGNPVSQYEKGLEALSSLDRIQQINALTEYNKMRDKLLDFLKSFKERKEVVKEEDIKAFFAGMKPKREPDGVYFCR